VNYLPVAHPISLNGFLSKRGFTPTADADNKNFSKDSLNYPLRPLECKGGSGLNVLLILVDSLRADAFNKEVMPNSFERFEASPQAFNFTDHLSGGNATQAGLFSIFYGLPSVYWDAFSASKREPVLMEELRKAGYENALYSAVKLTSPEFHKNVFAGEENLRVSSEGEKKFDRDLNTQKDFRAFLDGRDAGRPFFGFLFYDSPHGFTYPPDFKEKFTPVKEINYILLSASTAPGPYMNRYKNSVNFVDGLLGEIYAMLDEKNLWENTVVILSADHGQEINDTRSNFWGHNSNFASYQSRVPLVVWWPGKKGGVMDYRTTHMDVAPTLLEEVLGCAAGAEAYSLGENIFNPVRPPYNIINSYNKRAIVEGDNITVLDNYGALENYDMEYKKRKDPVSPKAISSALSDMQKFYK
jgi:membrane-anchored protein YejM (alkaline phosphatase superfamily)